MSAFVVDPDCMDRVVRVVLEAKRFGSPMFRGIPALGFDRDRMLSAGKAGTALGRALYRLNVDAVSARYPGDSEMTGKPGATAADRYGYTPRLWTGSKLGFLCDGLKAVDCLSYQCSEGDIPERPGFAALEEIGDTLRHAIVSELPEYAAAAWG